ncbi:ankyrin repeat domain-containing protein 26 isoform X6 [Scyliorhinus canicula]|uniref:ankyrin repeat domain-containing protein 26 isoform X6 n=1 Tax=Scyliorhinus canicula TaxID=7830 RepID=UPI0018F43B4A|nr:ankyrin repeat domain-containing protein 26 isoform X6 [Scyliorhinus canicula]
MKKILRFAKRKRKFSPNTSDTGSVLSAGYELREKDLGKLHKAASTGDLSKLRQLVKKNDVNQLDKENRAPLHLACASGHAEAVSFLVENKSKVNICDNDNRSPLMKAVQCQQERCAVILLDHNADPNLVDINGNTALHLAALIPNISLVMHLIEHEAHRNARNKDGCTPLLLAVIGNHQEIVDFLLKEGADVNAKDKTGRTALMIAASNGQISLVKLLLRYDADVSLKEDKGWTAEDHAMMNGHHACSHLITEHDTKKKLHQSPYYGASKVKGEHASAVGFALGGPATDKEEFQESPEQKWRTSDSEKVPDDASQTESVSRASKGAGDSWLSSNDDEELQVSSKVSQKFSLTKLLNTSQKSKENVNAKANSGKVQNMDSLHPVESDVDSEEESEEDSQDEEEMNENSRSPAQPSPQAKPPLLASSEIAEPLANSFMNAQFSSTPFKGHKQDRSLEEATWPDKLCSTKSRASATQSVHLDGASTYAAQANKTAQQKNRRDLLLELGLEEAEAEEHIESPWDSESATESPQKKSNASFVSSPVKSQAEMQHLVTTQNNEPSEVNIAALPPLAASEEHKQKSDLIAELGLIDAGDTEDASDWDSVSASGKKVSPNVFSSTPQINLIREDDKPPLQSVHSPKREMSNTKTVINILKSNFEETTCVHRTSQLQGSPDSLKTGLNSHPSVQHQVASQLQLKSTISAKQENVHELKISLSMEEDKEKKDNEKEEKNDRKMEVEEEKNKNFQNREKNSHTELGISESARQTEESIQQQNSESLVVKLAKGYSDLSKQLQADVPSRLDKEKRNKDRTKKTLFKGTVLGTDEENYETHQRNQPKQADQDLRNIELKSIERLVRLQQISTMNGDALSAFDDSTTSEMSQDEARPFKSSASKKFTRPITISDDLDDLTQSSDTATDGSESPSSAYRNTPLLIAQLDAEAIDSVGLLKIQNLVHEYERAVEREKKRYALLSDKVKYLENERKDLHQKLDQTREIKSKLECQKRERDTDFNSVKFSLKQEEEKRKIAEMLYEKSRGQLQKKELQYCEELQAKRELELIIRNLEMENKSLISNIEQLDEEQHELQRQFKQEQAVHKEILNNHLHRQREIEQEEKITVKNVQAVTHLCDIDDHEKDVMQQNRSLQDEITVLKLELDRVRERNQEEQGKYIEQIEVLKERLDDTKKDLKFNEEALAHTALQYNGQLNTLKTEMSMLTSKLELEKQNKEKLETEMEAIRSQLSVALQELERSQAAKCESEQILQREHGEWHHSDEKRNYEISSLRETNNSLSQKLSKAEEKANSLDYELHRATLNLAEKNVMLESVQRNLHQSQTQINDFERANRLQKEQISKFAVRQESMQERLAQAQSEIMLLRQQLEDAQNKGIMKEKAVTDVQDRFSDIFSKLRRDSERQISLVEERNKELVSKTIEQREHICKFENEKIERETSLRQLQQELADVLKKLSMSEASLEVTTRYRNEIEQEKTRTQKQLEKLTTELQETKDECMQSERKIQQLQNALDDKERDVTATSQKMQEALSASSRTREAAKQLDEHVQRLEIENAKLESIAKQQANKSDLMEKELQDTVSVHARLEDLITSLQGMKVNLEDQLGQEVQKQTMLSQSAKDSHQLWEEELKTRSKLGLRLSQLNREKDDLTGQVEIEKKKVKKLAEFKRSVETRLAQEMKRNNELQRELNRMRTLLKTAKKKLKEYDSGQFVTQVGGIQELDHEHSETAVTINKLKTKIDDLSQQLEAESAKCRRLESTSQELSAQITPMRILQKNQDWLENRKHQLEEEVASLKHQLETNVMNYSHLEKYKREVEEHARKEIKQKLEEVNLFLQTQQASQEALEQLRATNESTVKSQLEQRIKDLESELSNLRASQQDSMNLKESAHLELERYKELYSEELKLRKSLAAKLDRSNERLAETNTKLLNERQRSKSLIASSIMNGSLTTTPALDMAQLQSTMGHVGNLGTFNRNLGSSFLNPVEDGLSSTNKVEAYLAKMQDALQKNISKELVQATADLDRGSTRVSPLGSAAGSLKSINQDQDPVTKATEQYLEVLKKNYML